MDYPISIIPLASGYPALSLSKSQQVTKIVWRDVIGYCYSYLHILNATPLSINEISLHYRKTNLNKVYLVCL